MFQKLQNWFSDLPPFLWNLFLAAIALIVGLMLKLVLSWIIKKDSLVKEPFSVTRSLIKRLNKPFTYFLPLLVFDLLIPLMTIEKKYEHYLDKIIFILLSLSVAYILISIVKVFEDYAYFTYDIQKADNLKERKIRTQLQFVRRIAIGLIVIVTICIILLSFDNLRRLGAGLLTGVGVGGIIIGFAAQKSLSNLLAGFQIAFTQPLRIDDVLVVEGEWGRVEEITLTYVVLKIWDQRRLILPINYFIEKPFQNWTRTEADITGTIFLYLDYHVPFDKLRAELTRLLELSALWDKRVNILQVTNTSEKGIEVRALVSSRNSSDAFDLRCYIREGLVTYIRENYPLSLPVTRAIIIGGEPAKIQEPES